MITERFHLEEPPPVPNKEEVRPTNQALIIDPTGPRLMRWGLEVKWSKQPMINARAETLAEKPTFKSLLERRCIVPMTAYFEWRTDAKAKLKNTIVPDAANGPFAFAGLSDGDAFTIVTCWPAASVAQIHSRMPVILDADHAARWADPNAGFDAVNSVLAPFTGEIASTEDAPPPLKQADLFG
ncbi:MAG: SOS response-associated peptidase family protein [Rhodospirillaceae bacterium]